MKLSFHHSTYKVLLLFIILKSFTIMEQALAAPINQSQAKKNVQTFLEQNGKIVSISSLHNVSKRALTTPNQLLYIFNVGRNNGYVIAAGDDCAPAILGYADSGSIDLDSIPVNLKVWLDEYGRQIQYIRDHKLSSSESFKSTPSHPTIDPLLSSKWGQENPYNINCPSFFGQGQCVTGCVATAMAQIMYYHRANSVTCTTNIIPAYTCESTWTIDSESLQLHVDAIPAGSVIDWDNMLDTYSNSATDEQKQAVANLMKYCGAAVKMDYGTNESGSGAYSSDVPYALKSYFGYSEKTVIKSRNSFSTDAEWDSLIYSELSYSRPVYYCGMNENTGAGHAFVCDGYKDNGYYHINWGWVGKYDGYFLLSALNIPFHNYNTGQRAIINAEPKLSLISFADENVKAICIQNWDTNGDGELSEREASEVTSLGEVFKNSQISSFDELRHFIRLKSINDNCFSWCENLNSITLPSSVTSIGDYAFEWCRNLTSITIPSSVTSIGKHAFEWCLSLPSLTIPYSVTSIGDFAFAWCRNLSTLSIPNSVNTIGDGAFQYCNGLTSITIPRSISSIGNFTFEGCSSLTSITIPNSVISIGDNALGGCLSLSSITIPSSVKTISARAFSRCSNLSSITLNHGITSIGDNAFEGCESLQAINIPSSVISIGREAFRGCIGFSTILVNSGNLKYDSRNNCNAIIETASNTLIVGCKNTVIPTDVVAIGENAFRDCSSLTNLNIPSSVSSIGQNAFSHCSGLCSITVDPNNLTYDSRNNCNAIMEKSTNVLILGCKNTIIPTTANIIGDRAFDSCNGLESISIPSSVNSIGILAFSGCTSLSSVSIPSSVTIIGASAFNDCVCLKNLDIPIGVITIGSGAFNNCRGITTITIPSSVATIEMEAFRECSALTNVTIGRNVSKIGSLAFDRCDAIMTVTCLGSVPRITGDFWGNVEDCFTNRCFAQATLRVPYGYVSDYLSDEHWSKFDNIEGFEYNSRGDADGDGKVTIADVTTLIDYLLSGNAGSVDIMGADADNDDKVTIADVTTLIDFLLSGVWPYTPDIPNEPETEKFTVNGVSFNMVTVEAGTFIMGASSEQNNAYEDESPTHRVTLTDYSIGQTEVTQELWQAVMGYNPSSHIGNLKYPVDCVNWDMAQEFITKLNAMTGLSFRLPTEAEWEFAARGGRKSKCYKHAGSNDLNEVAWYCDNSDDCTHPVGLKKANELGIYDMNGNIWEWTQDWYAAYSSEAQTNPIGPASGEYKVHRGGCFNNVERQSRVSGERGSYEPGVGSTGEGFRLAMSTRLILDKDYAAVVVGGQVRIGIENSPGHSFNVIYASEYVTCRVEGESVIITGLKEGTTKVTIIDRNYNVKATLTVVIVKGHTFTVNGASFAMVTIDGGSFTMGATNEQEGDARDNEKPTHEVTLSGFSIGQTEVTQELWKAVMGSNNSSFTGDLQRPEEQVSWNRAQEFISKLNELTGKTFRLPTEAEWEYAARGGNKSLGYKYAGSNNIEEVAWHSPDGPEDSYALGDWDLGTHAVAKKKPNELGLYDMSGNVAEWCYDWRGNYTSESQINPTGPVTGTSRILRGGSWSNCAKGCRVSFRESDGTPPDRISFNFGLRLVLDEKKVITVNGVPFTMIKVKGGTFTMGATDEQGTDADSNESPTHQVTLSDYYIGQTEVTQELWQAVMGNNPSSNNSDMKYPVNRVSWNKAQDFITQLNSLTGMSFRLPTEAEWEFAARGGNMSKGYKHAGSNDLNEVAWYGDNSDRLLHVVGLKKPNELGIYDMNGNVWEWTQDWYGLYSSEAQTNPSGPSSGSRKVQRGGCFNNNSQYSRVSGVRQSYFVIHGGTGEGLRLAL